MKYQIIFSLMLLGCLLSFGNASEQKLNVVTTTSDLKSLAETIGGEWVSVNSLTTGSQDPHFVEAKPTYIKRAQRADLWIRIGLELEIGYESLIIDGSRNQRIRPGNDGHLDASEGVLKLEVPTGKIDRTMGDIHPFGNPHHWLDPYNGRIIARNICERLKKLASDKAETFDKNYQAFIKKLDESMFGAELVKEIGGDKPWELELAGKLDEFINQTNAQRTTQDALAISGWSGKMRLYKGKKIITYHRGWTYFANRFGLVVADELEPKPGIPPSPKHLIEVIKKIDAENIKILLMEPFYSREAPDFVAKKTCITIVEAANSVGGEKEATDYISMLNNLVEKVDKAFK